LISLGLSTTTAAGKGHRRLSNSLVDRE
jgi:hypothetical protein